MMIERRQFLQAAIGTASTMAMPTLHQASVNAMADPRLEWTSTFEQTLMASDDGELLGIPKSWQCVRQGFHPFSPERTLILPSQTRHNRQAELAEPIAKGWGDAGVPINAEVIRLIFQAAPILTHVYGVEKRTKVWASRMLVWLLQFYSNVAQDFQWVAPCSWQGFREEVETSNRVVDWWLILIPQGVEIPSIDGTQLHTLITPVYTEIGKPRLPAFFWDFMTTAIGLQHYFPGATRLPDRSWWELSHMDARSACLTLNQHIAHNLLKMT